MEIFLLSIIFVGLSIFGLCFNIIFKKDGKFPDKEVGHNKEMRKLGITCAKAEEKKMWSKKSRVKKVACTEHDCSHCEISRD